MKKRTIKFIMSIALVMTMIFALSIGAFVPAQAEITSPSSPISPISPIDPIKPDPKPDDPVNPDPKPEDKKDTDKTEEKTEKKDDSTSVVISIVAGGVLVALTVVGSVIYFKKIRIANGKAKPKKEKKAKKAKKSKTTKE